MLELESENSVPVTVRKPATESETTMEPNVQDAVADWQMAVNGPINTKPLMPISTVVFLPDGAEEGETYATVARRSFLKRMGHVATQEGQTDSFEFVYCSEKDKVF